MTMKRNISASLLAALVAQSSMAGSYTVKKGDTLGQITLDHKGGPVWGEAGTLKTIMRLNPQIRNPNLIYPRQVIHLDEKNGSSTVRVKSLSAKKSMRKVKSYHDQGKNKLKFSLISSDSKLNGYGVNRDYASDLDSNVNTGAELSLGKRISNSTMFGGYFKAMQSSYDASVDGEFKGEEETLKSIGLFAEHSITAKFSVFGKMGVEQAFFFNNQNDTVAAMEPVYMDSVSAGAAYDFLRYQTFKVGVAAQGEYASKGNGEALVVKDGFVYGADLRAQQTFAQSYEVLGSVFYRKRVQDTEASVQESSEQGVSLGVAFKY